MVIQAISDKTKVTKYMAFFFSTAFRFPAVKTQTYVFFRIVSFMIILNFVPVFQDIIFYEKYPFK